MLLNGSSTSKEETIGWADAFLAAGIAVLALDWPGTGEAMLTTGVAADCDDMVDGIVAAIETHPLGAQIDARRLALVGFSLGAVPAVRTAALDRRVRATVAVTPPFDPTSWLPYANSLLLAHLAGGVGGYQALYDLAPAFSLVPYAARLVSPLLVIGAGRDLIVPPNEALRLCAATGDRGALLSVSRRRPRPLRRTGRLDGAGRRLAARRADRRRRHAALHLGGPAGTLSGSAIELIVFVIMSNNEWHSGFAAPPQSSS